MKRTDWIISGFLAVLFLAVIGGFLIFWLQSRALANAPASQVNNYERGGTVKDGITAVDALGTADIAAQAWQADAQMVTASATIVRFDQLEDIYGGRTNWNVVYYSPSTAQFGTFTVTDQGAKLLGSKQADFVPRTIERNVVVLNSGQAMTLAVANGGSELFVGDAQRVAHLRLEKKESGLAEWFIIIQNETAGLNMQFRIDAENGVLIEKSDL